VVFAYLLLVYSFIWFIWFFPLLNCLCTNCLLSTFAQAERLYDILPGLELTPSFHAQLHRLLPKAPVVVIYMNCLFIHLFNFFFGLQMPRLTTDMHKYNKIYTISVSNTVLLTAHLGYVNYCLFFEQIKLRVTMQYKLTLICHIK